MLRRIWILVNGNCTACGHYRRGHSRNGCLEPGCGCPVKYTDKDMF